MDVGSPDGGFDPVVFALGTQLSPRGKILGRVIPKRLDNSANEMNVPVELDHGTGERNYPGPRQMDDALHSCSWGRTQHLVPGLVAG